MNIFALDPDPAVAAQQHVDLHVTKMTLETAQILSAVHHIHNSSVKEHLYRLTHKKHPCVKWTASHPDKYDWLLLLLDSFNAEYIHRYDNGNHASYNKLFNLFECNPLLEKKSSQNALNRFITPSDFPLVMPNKYKTDNPFESYRKYYKKAKSHLHTWTNRQKPSWM